MVEKFTVEEEVAFRYLFKDKLSVAETVKKMKQEGYDVSPESLRNFKKRAFKILLEEEKAEHLSEFLLESFDRVKLEFEELTQRTKALIERFDRVKLEFEELTQRTKALIERFEREGKVFGQLEAIRELRNQLTIALKRLGELQSGVKNITLQKNIFTVNEFVQGYRMLREHEFEAMQYELKDGKLIINKPSPELLDDFYKWKRKKAKKEREQVKYVEIPRV